MDTIFIKIKKARELLKLTQVAIADLSGVSQRNVSDMENGSKKFIPTNYIQFLHINGIDINSIFDDSFEVRKRELEYNSELTINSSDAVRIKEQDAKIIELSEKIGELKYKNKELQRKLGINPTE